MQDSPFLQLSGPRGPAFMRLGVGRTQAMAVFLGAWLDLAGSGGGRGKGYPGLEGMPHRDGY